MREILDEVEGPFTIVRYVSSLAASFLVYISSYSCNSAVHHASVSVRMQGCLLEKSGASWAFYCLVQREIC